MTKPSDFFSETPPSRLIGTEAECNIQLPSEDIKRPEYISPEAIRKAGYMSVGRCLDNGMGLYVDVGHLEIDSAEALGPRQAAAATAAAIVVLNNIVEASGMPHGGLHRHSGTIVRGKTETSGYHESYMFPREITNSTLFDTVMASHLTSDIWTMCGTVHNGFLLSQKAHGIGDPPITRELKRRTMHGYKPMAMIPPVWTDSDVLGDPSWARLERRYADAGFSLTAQYVGFAAVSLVLRLIEHQKLVDMEKLKRSSFRDFAEPAYIFASDLKFSSTAETIGAGKLSAVDYQELLALTALKLSEKIELPKDEQDAIPIWLDICDALRASDLPSGEYGSLISMLDFAPRHRYLTNRFASKELNSNNSRALEANLTWDRILPHGGAMAYWSKIGSPYITKEEVQQLVWNAPPTRAAIRGAMIADPKQGITYANWAKLGTGYKMIDLDPYATP